MKTIVLGPPGTGKTTSLIQRIKFLLDDEFLEDKEMTKEYLRELSASQIDVIRKGIRNNNWIFFSPNPYLPATPNAISSTNRYRRLSSGKIS